MGGGRLSSILRGRGGGKVVLEDEIVDGMVGWDRGLEGGGGVRGRVRRLV